MLDKEAIEGRVRYALANPGASADWMAVLMDQMVSKSRNKLHPFGTRVALKVRLFGVEDTNNAVS